MADPTTSLRVRISADLADIKQGLAVLRGDLAKVKAEAAKSGPNTASWVNGLKAARQQVVAFVAAYATLRTVNVFASLSDEATQLRGRLQAAGADYERIYQIAQETRTGLASTADLYARMERSTRGQKVSQDDLLKITRAVNQAVKLSYADVGTAEASLTQLGQGLAAGTLRGEELNSVLEGTPRLAEAIAVGMGKTLAQIKQLGQDGKLTASAVLNALKDQASALEAEYSRVPTTIRDGFTQLRNAFLDYIGDQNDATGAAQAFAGVLGQVARDLPSLLGPVLLAVASIAKNFQDASTAADEFSGSVDGAATRTSAMATAGQGLASVLKVVAAAALLAKNVVEAVAIAVGALNEIATTAATVLGKYLGGSLAVVAGSWQALKDKGPVAAIDAYRKGASLLMKDLGQVPELVSRKVSLATSDIGQQISDIRAGIANLLDDPKLTTPAALAGVPVGGAGGGAGGATGKAVAASNAALRDSVTRALAELDRLYSENEVGISEYFQTRLALQQKSIDLEIAQARAEQAATKDLSKRQDLEDKILKLQRDRADAGAVAAREEKKAQEELTRQLGEVKIQLLELDGNAGAAARARLEEQYKDLFKRLEAESDKTGQAMVRNLIERLASKAQLDQLKDVGSRITSSLQSTESSVSAQVSGGLLGYGEGERRLGDARAKALADLQALRKEAAAYLATLSGDSPEGQAALNYLQSLDTEIGNVAASQRQFGQGVAEQGVDSLANLLTDLATRAKTAKEAVQDLVLGFVAGVARMAAQALALRAVQAILSAFGGAAGGAGGGASVAVQHAGGMAGVSGRRRMVDPALFGAAPRFHSGVNLAPDEVPAILQTGERVLSRRQNREYDAMRARAGGGEVTTPIVAIGDDAVANAIAGAAGERIVMTHVRNNWEGLTRGNG